MTSSDVASPFSLIEGGRFHAALARARLAGGVRGRLRGLAIAIALGWLPLVVLSAASGLASGDRVEVPLLADLGPWVRFFLVVPVLILAEPFADRALGAAVRMFRESGVVPEGERSRFDDAVTRAQRVATSDTAELVILAAALAMPHFVAASLPRLISVSTAWFGALAGGEVRLTGAGRWYAWVSLPLLQFLLLRWAWRIVAWWGLLWRVARLALVLRPAHPDRAGGLGFLALAPNAFVPVFVAVSALGAVAASAQIRLGGRNLAEVRGEIVALVVLEAIALLVPQLFFWPRLARARRAALDRYSLVGTTMAAGFDRRWTEPSSPPSGELLESPHSSAMIDFAGTYGLVEAMSPTGLSIREVVRIVLPLAVPFAPLLLYQYSLKEILLKVLEMVR